MSSHCIWKLQGQTDEPVTPAPRPSLRWMCSYFRQLIESWPRAGRLSAGGQTKASSSVMVPEASPLSIDPLSPNFSVTYARLNSHYCAHWSLIGENNRPVVTEGKSMSAPRHSASANSWLLLLEPSPWPSPLLAQAGAKAGRRRDAEVDLRRSRMNQKMGSCWFHQNEEKEKKKKKTPPNTHNRLLAIKLSLWCVSSDDDSRLAPALAAAPPLGSSLSPPFNYVFRCSFRQRVIKP